MVENCGAGEKTEGRDCLRGEKLGVSGGNRYE